MAQIINREQVTTADLISSLMTDFQTLFNFSSVDTENSTMNITTELYMKFAITNNTLNITFGNSNGDMYIMTFTNATSSYTHYYQLIKSTSGDVALRLQTKNALIDNNFFQFALVRVTQNNETYSWGVFSPSVLTTITAMPITQPALGAVQASALLLCEDNVKVGPNIGLINSASTTTAYNLSGGCHNPNATYTFLSNVFNMYTKYTTVNFKMMLMTPQPYNRVCTFGTNKYYCIALFAMLDNDL